MEAQKVKDAVDEEAEHLFGEGGGALGRPLRAEHHIPQEVGMKSAHLPLPHGEGQDVGRASLPAELPVEAGHLLLFHQEEAELVIRTGQGL